MITNGIIGKGAADTAATTMPVGMATTAEMTATGMETLSGRCPVLRDLFAPQLLSRHPVHRDRLSAARRRRDRITVRAGAAVMEETGRGRRPRAAMGGATAATEL